MGYSPWGFKELDATEQLSTHTHWNLTGTFALIWPKENLLFIWLMQKKKKKCLLQLQDTNMPRGPISAPGLTNPGALEPSPSASN